jgi:DNA-directed RNA polymerase specialized sigma24 family protein
MRLLAAIGRTPVVRESGPRPAEDDAAAARLDAEAELRHAAGVLRTLARGDRDALLLFAWAELGYEEISLSLNIPVGTVRSRINRARRRLREERAHALSTRKESRDGRTVYAEDLA